MHALLLASASPRRSALLRQIYMPHEVRVANIDESQQPDETPADYVLRLARGKAEWIWGRLPEDAKRPVLGADTTVALGQRLFGKPADRAEGIAMLQSLAATTHQVYTAVALCHGGETTTQLSLSQVTFAPLSMADCAAYWDSGEPQDKAGGYAVQGLAAAFITRIEGSYSGVMGLPLAETAALLSRIGWSLPRAVNDDPQENNGQAEPQQRQAGESA